MPTDFDKIITYGSTGTGDSNLDTPMGLDTDGIHIYIADNANHRIQKWLLSGGTFVKQVGSEGSGNNNFNNPSDVLYYEPKNILFICDTDNHRIKIHDAQTLRYIGEFGSSGSGNSNFSSPKGLAHDGMNLYISDSGNSRIVVYKLSDLTFKKKKAIGSTDINGIVYDSHENVLYVPRDTNKDIFKYRVDTFLKLATITIATSVQLRGVAFNNHVLYVFKSAAADNLTIEAYDGSTLTSRKTKSITLTGAVSSRIKAIGECIIFSDEGTDQINIYYNHNAERGQSSSGAIKAGGSLFQQPTMIAGDIVIAGQTEQSSPTNRWIEEDKTEDNLAWVKE